MGPSPGPLLQGGAASILSYTLVGGGHIPLGKGSMRPDERLRHTPVTGGLVGEHSRIKDPEPVVLGHREVRIFWLLAYE